jgi:UDP-3-O-[3-hydroxymyristoyl] N-acetylglucosamine deacetylase
MFDAPLTPEKATEIANATVSGTGSIQWAGAGRSAIARQRTLKSAISCTGVGLHSGATITMTLHPAEAGSGIRFRRVDASGAGALIPALWSNVTDTRLNTCISNGDGVSVRTVEHLMAALAGMAVDNVVIEIHGEEVPVMDGSAAPFVFLIECAGVVEQSSPRQAIKLLKRVMVRDGDKVAMLSPADDFTMSVDIDFEAAAIGRQEVTMAVDSASFKAEISRARTFGFEQEIEAMRAAGLGRGGSLDNAVVISGDGRKILNQDGLRYGDEFVRHKMLDALGDLALAGAPLQAHFTGALTGHALNNRLLRTLFADTGAWVRVPHGVQAAIAPSRAIDRNSRLVAAASR